MANAKEKICKHAKHLFNEKGYNNVSLRDIAEAAGTTIGNLTYHFPLKEDLIFAIQEELYTEFLTDYVDKENESVLFEKMLTSFLSINKSRDNNTFFYRNIVELSQESKLISRNIEDFRTRVYHYYLSCFLNLREHDIMRSDITIKQYETLAYIIVNMAHIWVQITTQYYDENIPKRELHHALKDLICPYLTQHGMDLYNNFSLN